VAELPRPLEQPTLRDRVVAWQHRAEGPPVGLITLGVIVAVAVVVAVGVTYFLTTGGPSGGGGGDVALSLPRADESPSGDSSPSTTRGGALHVHAAGAVMQPGVVQVPAGSRVTDVVAAAGGPVADADLDQVNLAAPVSDGERVYIPHKGESASVATGGVAATASDGVVNINQADQATLETLPGVGPATAKAIIDYRTEHGRFKNVDELLNVRGIGPSKLSEIKPHARV
jgi:competence protein ComEA